MNDDGSRKRIGIGPDGEEVFTGDILKGKELYKLDPGVRFMPPHSVRVDRMLSPLGLPPSITLIIRED